MSIKFGDQAWYTIQSLYYPVTPFASQDSEDRKDTTQKYRQPSISGTVKRYLNQIWYVERYKVWRQCRLHC